MAWCCFWWSALCYNLQLSKHKVLAWVLSYQAITRYTQISFGYNTASCTRKYFRAKKLSLKYLKTSFLACLILMFSVQKTVTWFILQAFFKFLNCFAVLNLSKNTVSILFCDHKFLTHSFLMHPFSTLWKHQKT